MISGLIFRVIGKIPGYMCLRVWTGKESPMHMFKLGEETPWSIYRGREIPHIIKFS